MKNPEKGSELKVLTGLELRATVNELRKSIIGAKLNKIYQPTPKTLLFGVRKLGKKSILKIDSGVGVYITEHDYKTQKIPPSFCMFLRKYLMSSTLSGITQRGTERIIEFKFDSKEDARILICELFGNGNFILCDKEYKILNLAVNKIFKDRTLKKGSIYNYPPEKFNILNLTQKEFIGALESWKDHEIVKMLAAGLGLGGIYAEEICLRSKVSKNKICSQISKEVANKLFEQVQKLLLEFEKSKNGFIYEQDDDLIDVSPLRLHIYSELSVKQVASFNEAVDLLFASKESKRLKAEKSAHFEGKLRSLKQRLDIQKESLNKYEKNWKSNQKIADEVYNNYQIISNILDKLGGALKAGFSWDEIKSVIEQEKAKGIHEALLIRELIPQENKAIIDIAGGMELNLRKSITANAEVYYDKAKTSRLKISGAEKIVSKTEKDIQDLMNQKEKIEAEIEKSAPKPFEVTAKEWYEKFRWFFTSSGLLAIGGKDATQNDMLIKKYMELKDQVFHTELPGSPFFLLKDGRDKSTETDRKEVATATATFSKAWAQGISSTDVYWVKPEQVTKQAQAGEYLSKGAFMIRGKKNFLRNTVLEISIGKDKTDRIISGPKSAVSKHTVEAISVRRGSNKKSDIAKKIAKKINSTRLDDIMQALPGGTFSVDFT